ncbi:MAG: PD40 domain-containing protein [Gemmatimonadetes bacterium]|nr:PD40 domain-containing protein [Gemmatimonadota bacterium]
MPRWSPDGNGIAMFSNRSGPLQIWKIRPDGSGLTQLTHAPGNVAYAVWSPDGRRLAGMIAALDRGIITYTFASRTYQRLTDYGQWPVWLPDSRRLLFVSGGKAFYIVDGETKQVRRVFSVTRDVIGPPQLTRDGRTVYFSRRVTEADIWLVTLP